MGRMVLEDVTVDVNGVPHKIPEPHYQRVPLHKTEKGTYDDWVRRRGNEKRRVEGIIFEVNRLRLEVEKLSWERKLQARPPLSQEESECNRKIVEILTGISTFRA